MHANSDGFVAGSKGSSGDAGRLGRVPIGFAILIGSTAGVTERQSRGAVAPHGLITTVAIPIAVVRSRLTGAEDPLHLAHTNAPPQLHSTDTTWNRGICIIKPRIITIIQIATSHAHRPRFRPRLNRVWQSPC